MKATLENIKAAAMAELQSADADLEQIRVRYLGKKGELTAVLRGIMSAAGGKIHGFFNSF